MKTHKIITNSLLSNSKTKNILNRFSLLLFVSLVASPAFANESSQHHSGKHSSKQMSNFGPGDHYQHEMSINLSEYKKIRNISKPATDLPKALNRKQSKTVQVKLQAFEVISKIAPNILYHYWTFNQTVPGPFLRVREDDTVELSLHNDKSSSHSHGIDLHAVTGPGGGMAITKAEPGETKTLTFKATTPGLYIYHCAAGNPATHIANGMYGMILVEPKQGLAKVDHEFYIMQGELYTHGKLGKKGYQKFSSQKMIDEHPEYIIFNGRTGALVKEGQLNAKVGDKIRMFVGNAGVTKISSFHVIGEIFDRVYPEAGLSNPIKNIQTTLIPAGGATVVEFKADYPGNYVLVDHALARVDRGAWGILNITGSKNDSLYSGDSDHADEGEEREHHKGH
jgi:nitrite reductase (NO-forming)